MTDTPLVSIALATYNGSSYILEQLSSLASQTFKNFELIICDDHSIDDTVEKISSFTHLHPDIAIKLTINEKQMGLIKNFEQAIRKCSGKYIALCDQDDVWYEDKLQTMVSQMDGNTLVWHDSQLVDDRLLTIKESFIESYNVSIKEGPELYKALYVRNFISGHAMMFDSKILSHIPTMRPPLLHDEWIAITASIQGNVKYINRQLVAWRQHASNTTQINQLHTRLERLKNKFNRHYLNRANLELIDRAKVLFHAFHETEKFSNGLLNYFSGENKWHAFLFALKNIKYLVNMHSSTRKFIWILKPLFFHYSIRAEKNV
jgi:glycosyltransferase involved in cell wall biosynthesis